MYSYICLYIMLHMQVNTYIYIVVKCICGESKSSRQWRSFVQTLKGIIH